MTLPKILLDMLLYVRRGSNPSIKILEDKLSVIDLGIFLSLFIYSNFKNITKNNTQEKQWDTIIIKK